MVKDVENGNLEDTSLKALTNYFLNWRQFQIAQNQIISGMTGQDHNFDFLISNDQDQAPLGNSIGVMIFDYKKHCGTDSVIKAERAAKDCDLNKMMVISNGFSSSAQAMAKRAGILTLSRGELMSILRIHRADIMEP